MFNFQKNIYFQIRRTFKYYIKRRRKNVYKILEPHIEEILALSSFLFISSSFIFSVSEEQHFNFNWKSFFKIYKSRALDLWSSCAIRYILDVNPDFTKKYYDKFQINSLEENFSAQYTKALKNQYKIINSENLDEHVKKQNSLMEIVLKVHCLYHQEIPKEPGKVIDLVWYLSQFKRLVLDVFKYKAEYVLFCFLVNLAN